MLVFGHTGITLGMAVLSAGVLSNNRSFKTKISRVMQSRRRFPPTSLDLAGSSGHRVSPVACLANYVDIRLLLISSLLPDIIDKMVGMVFLADSLSNGRIYCHTLLFLIIISLAGLYLAKSRGNAGLLVLSFGSFTHLIFDQMWLEPRTLLWPLYGFKFDKVDLTHWLQDIFHALSNDPDVFVPEFLGIIILAWLGWWLWRRGRIIGFIKYGQVP